MVLVVKNPSGNAGDERPSLCPWVRKIPCRREWLPTPVLSGSAGGSDGKESACNVGDLGLSPGIGMIPTAKSLDRRAWWATVHTLTQS